LSVENRNYIVSSALRKTWSKTVSKSLS